MDQKLTLTLYRSILRSIRTAYKSHPDFRLMTPLKPESWGTGAILPNDYWRTYLESLDWVADLDDSKHVYTQRELFDLVREWFAADQDWVDDQTHLERVFESLQFINFQKSMNEASSITKKRGVEIIASSVHFDQSEIQRPRPYVFAYRVHIRNDTEAPIMLKQLDWRVSDANGNVQTQSNWSDLSGCKDGRKTEHPILLPGQCFTYVSGADIDTPTGQMSGSFGAYNLLNHTEFEIPVNKFNLDANAPLRGKCAFTCVDKDEMQNLVFK